MYISQSLLLVAAGITSTYAASYVAQFSPEFPNIATPTDAVKAYPTGPYDTSATLSTTKLSGFPAADKTPSTSSSEVQAVYNAINWSKVPPAPVRKIKSNGGFDFSGDSNDDYCWWSNTNCVSPKVSYLPPDLYTCPNDGDWGLNYDDGPFNLYTDGSQPNENKYAEPALYNFLAKTNQKAALFYIGSNVVSYPAAAKRALNDGHYLCVHTWSHQPMTTLSNDKVVAELYWGLKAIKAATGVTPKCWRPPQGDVDDRVRAIAYQMGMRTILWDEDTNDWDMPAVNGGGGTSTKTVDASFQKWIDNYKSGKDKKGHIILEHELNSVTVNMSEFWMPKIQKVFNVIPALACNGVTKPYWEDAFVYPLTNSYYNTATTTTTTTTTTATRTGTATTTTAATTTTTATATATATCISGSSGKKKGDGYKGYCCTSSDDCLDTCVSGKCNGPSNTITIPATATATATTTTTTTKKATTTTTTKKATTTTTKKTTTKTTTTKAPTSTSKCTAGVSGKKKGNGATGYCCTSSDDCKETCRSGVCGL